MTVGKLLVIRVFLEKIKKEWKPFCHLSVVFSSYDILLIFLKEEIGDRIAIWSSQVVQLQARTSTALLKQYA
tara:strand:+ start:3078 stop:3293 length:216 start_codon:yes stop_codon:yes gene_type:complete